jgi:flavin-binding protein dodecin
MPDGAYYLKIAVTDSPSNPPDQALSTERQSDRFEIANTPPRIEDLRADAGAATVRVSFAGISLAGAIAEAEYSVDAGDWQIVLPVGQLSDAPKENYRFEISGLAVGEHVVAVQVTDGFNNITASKVTFTLPARPAK